MKYNKIIYTLLASLAMTSAMVSCDKEERTELDAGIIYAQTVSIDKHELGLTIGEKETESLTATLTPDNVTRGGVVWASTEPTIASVDEQGIVTARRNGVAHIVASSADGKATDTCKVVVGYIPTTDIQFSITTAALDMGSNPTVQLECNVFPADAAFKTVTWKSLDTSIATVNRFGLVTAVSNGTVDIVGTTYDGQTDTCRVTVSYVPTTDIVDVPETLYIKKGERYVLTPTVLPEDAYYQNITWVSNATGIVSVGNGRVSGVAAGTAKLIASIYRKAGNFDLSNVEFRKTFVVVVSSTTNVDFDPYPEIDKWN